MRQKLVDHVAAHIIAYVRRTQRAQGVAWLLYPAAQGHVDFRRWQHYMKRLTAEVRNAARFGL
jgi:hypothetical protein